MGSKGPPGMVTRRSMSRPDSSGGRKDIPITANSLDLLKPSPEQPVAGDSRPSSAGPPRCKTPVGGAVPPRRTSSANRYGNIQVLVQQPQPQEQQQHGGLPDDDSLVLYKDPSGLSMQQSVASVASGRHQEGETFFTALRRSFSSGSESELEQHEAAAGGLSYVDSQANPMCSPSTSAFFSARDERSSFCSAGASLQDEYSQAASMATCESSSILCHEASGAAGLAPTASVLDVINSLYYTNTAAAGAGAQQQPKWHEPDPNGRPLMQLGASAAGRGAAAAVAEAEAESETPRNSSDDGAAAAPHEQQSCHSSVGSWDPAATAQATAASDDAAAEHQQQAACKGVYAPSLGSAASAGSAADLSGPEASSSSYASATAEPSGDRAEQEDIPAAEEGEQLRTAENDHLQQQQGGAGDSEAADGLVDDQAQAAACLAQVQEQLDSRLALQAELSGYVAGLTAQLGDDGEQLVTLPADYQLMVERLLRERRSQYRALEGWEGPRRFDELPVAQLPASHDDPRIAAGLDVIRQLDEQLKEAWIKAQVNARGSNPEQWAAAERERLAARAAQLDEALARERQKRLHAARLLRALHKLDEQQQADDALLLPGPCKGLNSYSYYKLQPQEEQLLAAVLCRDDAALEQHNPFDASTACPDADDDALETPAAAADVVGDVGQAVDASLEQQASPATAPSAPGTSAVVQPAVLKFAGSCCYSGRPSSEGSSRSMASGRAKHTLAEIDALLVALQVDHSCCAGHGAGLGSSMPSIATLSSAPGSRRSTITKDTAPAAAAAGAQRPRKSSASGANSVCSGSTGQTQLQTQQQQQQQQQQQRDYVREQREAKELQQREQEVDAQLRALRMSELPDKLQPEQLQALLQQCRQMQAAGSSVVGLS